MFLDYITASSEYPIRNVVLLFQEDLHTSKQKTLERCKLKTLSSPCIDKRLFMQSVALSLLRFTFFQSERLHKNTTTFKEIYTEIEDIQDIDTHFIQFLLAKNAVEV